MELSLSKLPWWGQIGAFVLVCAGATYGFWHFYVSEMSADITLRQTRLTALRSDIARGGSFGSNAPVKTWWSRGCVASLSSAIFFRPPLPGPSAGPSDHSTPRGRKLRGCGRSLCPWGVE